MTRFVSAFSVLFVALFSQSVYAEITQEIVVAYDADPNAFFLDDDVDRDTIRGQTDADINRALLVGIQGTGYQASGSVGEFGNFGVSGSFFRTGSLLSRVTISADVTAPPFAAPSPAEARFIIDGGQLNAVIGASSNVLMNLELTATTSRDVRRWESTVSMNGSLSGLPSVNFQGMDIGATQNQQNPSIVDIPLSFQTFELGILNPGESIAFRYEFVIQSQVPDFAEGIFFQFQDPLTLNPPIGPPFRPTIIAVPEPSSLLMLNLSGLLAIASMRRRA